MIHFSQFLTNTFTSIIKSNSKSHRTLVSCKKLWNLIVVFSTTNLGQTPSGSKSCLLPIHTILEDTGPSSIGGCLEIKPALLKHICLLTSVKSLFRTFSASPLCGTGQQKLLFQTPVLCVLSSSFIHNRVFFSLSAVCYSPLWIHLAPSMFTLQSEPFQNNYSHSSPEQSIQWINLETATVLIHSHFLENILKVKWMDINAGLSMLKSWWSAGVARQQRGFPFEAVHGSKNMDQKKKKKKRDVLHASYVQVLFGFKTEWKKSLVLDAM